MKELISATLGQNRQYVSHYGCCKDKEFDCNLLHSVTSFRWDLLNLFEKQVGKVAIRMPNGR